MPRLPQEDFAAFVGIDWADTTHDVCLQAVGGDNRECSRLAHPPEAIEAWARALQERCAGHPVAVCLARNTGPLVSALRKYAFLVLCPVNPAPLAKSRDAFTPSHATDDPTDAALQRERLLTPRDKLPPLSPQSAARRALAHLVAPRRRGVGDTVRRTNRRTRTLKNSVPHVLPWFEDQDTTLFCDFLPPWPTLQAVQLARRPTLARFFRAPHVRDPTVIATRLQAIQNALPLTTAAGGIAPHALLGQALVAQRRVLLHALADFDQASAQRAQRHPDFPWFATLPGAGAVCAPRLRVACGAQRERAAAANALPQSAGIAPGTARRGTNTWVQWRWPCPTCLRHTCVAWAAASRRHACWARLDSQPQRDKGAAQQAAVRALAFTGSRLLCRCGQERTPSAESVYLKALKHRGSPLRRHLAH